MADWSSISKCIFNILQATATIDYNISPVIIEENLAFLGIWHIKIVAINIDLIFNWGTLSLIQPANWQIIIFIAQAPLIPVIYLLSNPGMFPVLCTQDIPGADGRHIPLSSKSEEQDCQCIFTQDTDYLGIPPPCRKAMGFLSHQMREGLAFLHCTLDVNL